mmetsp:Transcript_2625/g.8786  ORF Transcript_2625/g.8786 Transcript_2625/m.8786 type:complete len:396 (+) Transcript_2625:806-1993(+)
MTSLPLRAATMAASFIKFCNEAPEKPMVREAMASMSTSGAKGLSRTWTFKIATLPALSGRSTGTRRSKRPGRRRALSRMSPRFVAAITMTPVFPEKPSISVKIWFKVCSRSSFVAKPPPEARWRPMASISSMKMMQGAFFFASAKRERILDAPTPTNISTNSEPDVEMKGTPASPATALASKVFPVPGGPSKSTPRGAWAPTFENFSGLDKKSTTSSSSSFEASQPATSSKVTPVFGSISILDLGWSICMGPPMGPPPPPMPPPRRPRKKRPPKRTMGNNKFTAKLASAFSFSAGAACTAKGTSFFRRLFTSSEICDGKISTECRPPSLSRARSSFESAENTTRSTPSFCSVSRNSDTAHRVCESAAIAGDAASVAARAALAITFAPALAAAAGA